MNRIITGVLLGMVMISRLGVYAQDQQWENVFSSGASEQEDAFKEKLGIKINLDYKDVEITTVLRSLSWTYGLNIVTSPDVKGKVTINLKDVTVDKALGAILSINGLTYNVKEGIIYVSPGDKEVVELASEVLFLKYVRAADAQGMFREVISSKGDLKIDDLANSLIITDYVANIEKVKKLLTKIDMQPRQVLIEAKIVDITTTDLRNIGITWSATYNDGKNTVTMDGQSSSLSGGQLKVDTYYIKDVTLTATIDSLIKDGKAHLLAAPSIAVLNGQEARIVIGERFPYKERTQTTTGTTETTKFVDIGTNLKVTPQINEDGYITMRVHPEVSSLSQALDAGPRITTREADTTVRVKEGETLVIGGLIKQKDNSSSERIPILGRLPLIGILFSRSERDAEQKELAVFITPKILRSEEEKKLISKRKAEQEKVFTTVDTTSELNIIYNLFKKAEHLDKGLDFESRRRDEQFRKSQALSIYEHIFTAFPYNSKAQEARFNAGLIYYQYLKNYDKAKEVLGKLISDYPGSPFAEKARQLFTKLDVSLMKIKSPRSLDLDISNDE
ncbi:MAG: secretin and TonB N-terminal domain-containing protein [Candidatus Omnitrophota bacterium]|nr:MAG: secretin and TonB N-terminal domain-containing protein [Candidatus Omnitrophota bacterium]